MIQRTAFTLIEMVVALVLASIMTVGLLRIVNVISRETMQLRSEQTDYVAAGFIADRMRDDFVNARGINAGPNSIALAGFVTGPNVLGRVQYETVKTGQRSLLIRRSESGTEVMWVGFGTFLFQSFDEINADDPVPEGTGGLPPLPTRFAISALSEDGRVLFREVIHHHAG